jgi:exosortase
MLSGSRVARGASESLSQAVQVESISTPLRPSSPSKARLLELSAIGAALVALYFSIGERLVGQWFHDPNFSHGIFVPAFSLFVLWENRKRLAALPRQPAWSGLTLLVFGLLILAAGVMGAELFLSRVSLLFVLAGLTVLFLGWDYLRAVAFPLAFLVLMIPIPSIILNQITSPLQTVAAVFASYLLPLLGVPVLREGNIIHLPIKDLEVADACSGIRSLMSLTTLAIIYGYLTEPRIWIRVTLGLAALPIAVIANGMRIVGTGLIVQHWGIEKAEGFFHAFSGWLIFVVSLLFLFLVHRGLQVLFGKE